MLFLFFFSDFFDYRIFREQVFSVHFVSSEVFEQSATKSLVRFERLRRLDRLSLDVPGADEVLVLLVVLSNLGLLCFDQSLEFGLLMLEVCVTSVRENGS